MGYRLLDPAALLLVAVGGGEMTQEEIRRYCKKHRYSREYAEFWATHPRCAVAACPYPSDPPHHIRTRGAGGTDGDLLNLCHLHHWMIHADGVRTFATKHPEVAERIAAVMEAKR